MDAQIDHKSHKSSLGHHFEINFCTAHSDCVKIFKNHVQKAPQNDVKIRQKNRMKEVLDPILVFVLSARQNDHPLGATSCPKVAPESPKPSFVIRFFVIF